MVFDMTAKVLKTNFLNIAGCAILSMVITAQSMKAQEEIIMFDMGSMSIGLLSEGQRQGGTNILIGATDEMIQRAIPDGTYPMATNAFVVEMGDKTVLFDAGLGQKTIDNLALYDKKPADVDIVFLTHCHGDHIGSLLINNKKSYPNASLYISKPEYDYYMNDAEMMALPENRRGGFTTVRNIFNAYKDKLVIFVPGEIENAPELIAGVRGVAAYGHTPGHVGYLLESEGEKLLMWGDLAHAMAIQMPFPEVAVTYDTNPVQAVASRQKILKYMLANNIHLAGAHIEFPGMGELIKSGATDGYDFILKCTCGGYLPESK
jgi:glyoxylase-like metal-dependent hydrolase (beta-lactamase superfamily II)